jgi:hypothetical protein
MESINWFKGSNGNLFGDHGAYRYCVEKLAEGEYEISRNGVVIARAPSVADAKLFIARV